MKKLGDFLKSGSVPEMTYNVFSGTLNPYSLTHSEIWVIGRLWTRERLIKYSVFSGSYSGYSRYHPCTSWSTVDCDSKWYKISSDAATFAFVLTDVRS